MTSTPNVTLPLLQPSQAQKHVTVNEALVLLDGIAQMRLAEVDLTDPPGSADDGACYGVAIGATGAWVGRDGQVALMSNGGWVFVTPKVGWRAWVESAGQDMRYDGTGWVAGGLTGTGSGAGAVLETAEVDVDLSAGGVQTLAASIPANAMVFAMSTRVLQDIIGSLSSWDLGTTGATNRFGSGMGLTAGSYGTGVLGSPVTYYGVSPLIFTPNGGDVTVGQLRVAMTYMTFALPAAS